MSAISASAARALHSCGVILAIRFGSSVTGGTHSESDTDIAILAKQPLETFQEVYEMQTIFAKAFNVPSETIDIVDLRTANPLLCFLAATEGELAFGDDAAFDDFHTLAVKKHIDAKRLYDMMCEYVRAPF